MAVNITATRTSSLFTDNDGDGVFDPGDTLLVKIRITNLGTTDATGISVTDTLSGITLVPGSVMVTPIAYDDAFSLTGNTPITINAAQGLLLNDIDPDGAGGNFGLTVTSVDTTGTQGSVAFNANGSFTFTPTTGFVGVTSFKYYVQDVQGLGNVTEGIVTMTVSGLTWYVDNTYGGENGASDGSYLKPFTTLTPLNNSGADADGAGDTIFVYHNGGNYTAGIALEAGQTLRGDGVNYLVNGHNIGGTERTGGVDNVATNAVISVSAGTAVTLATDNIVRGLTFDANNANAVGMADNGGSVTTAAGTLTVSNVSFTGIGQAVDIDAGGNLNVAIDSLLSSGSSGQGIQLAGTASSGTGLITGSFSVTGGHIQSSIGTAVLLGVAGGGTASSAGNVNFTYGGDITNPGGSIVEIQDRTGGTATFTGTITEGTINAGQTGILIDQNAGTVNFNGQTFISAGAGTGNAVTLTNNTGGTINFAPTGTGLDITTASGTGLTFTGGGTLNITGAGNTINTGTGAIMNLANGTMGTGGIAFQTLHSGVVGAANGNAITINNLDAAGAGTFSGGAVDIDGTAGAGADGINIIASNSVFGFASATIDNTTGDAIDITGTTPNTTGAVTFTTVDIDGNTGAGVRITGATNAVSINGGTIGTTNDTAGDGVIVIGGTGAVTVAAAIGKSSGGGAGGVDGAEAVDISGHSGGAIAFSGAITVTAGGGGIRLTNNTGGNINFTGDLTLNTSTSNGLNFTNTAGTGANVTLSEGSLDFDTTSGTAINATNSTIGAGSLTITGTNNSVAATTGRAINVDGVTLNATFLNVGVSGGGTTTGVFLKNTGSGGQFVVTGTGTTQGSGGTIANIAGNDMASIGAPATEGTGIYMENVSNVSLANMIFGANAGTMNNFGIRGENVNNFTLTDSEFRGAFGNNVARDEDTIRFGTGSATTGLTGTAVFQGNNIQGGRENNLSVYVYGNNTLNLTIRDTVGGDQAVFGQNSTAGGANHSFLMESGGTSNVTLNVNGVAFNGANGSLLAVTSIGSAVQNLQILNNTFHNGQATTVSGNAGVSITGSLTNSNITYNITDNSFKGTTGASIFAMFNGNSGTVNGVVHSNDFGTANGILDRQALNQTNYGSLNGGAFFGGIDSKFTGNGTINYAVRISDNTIRDSGSDGVIMLRSAAQDTQGTARVEATITNNTIDEAGAGVAGGIYVQVAGTGAGGHIGVNMTGNTIDVDDATGADSVVVDNGNSLSGHMYFPGYPGPANPFTELSTFLTSAPRNNVFPVGSRDSGTGGALYNPGGTLNGDAFSLAVPMMAMFQEVPDNGWLDFEVSPVTAPPSYPDPVPDEGSDQTTGQGGETGEPADDDGDSGGGGDPTPPGGGTPPTMTILTQAALESMVDAAIQRWADAGASAGQIAAMRAVELHVIDMAGIYVGASTTGVINIDSDAAGLGWFVDPTPDDDSEFTGSGTRLVAETGGAAVGKLDLLTVLMHELGHQIGLGDHYDRHDTEDLMYGYANVGERRLPADGDADGAVPGSIGNTAFALTPVSVGILPSNKAVDVFFKATIDNQFDKFITNLNNDSTISGSNFVSVIANEQNVLDSLTLGSTVYVDTNNNGLFDAGEGRIGVALQIYADTNDSGGWDAGDVLLGSTTTIANGAYSFVGLAPGDYIVVVTAANFNAGQALDDLIIVQGVAADPDNNVDNDNNGVAATGGAVASQTITLAFNNEVTADGTGQLDINNTLDFGFAANQPPVANDDSVSVGEDSGANDLTAQLLSNDTDPENDTRTITSATQGSFGTTSVVAGVLTYTPNGNYNGTDTFTYTIDDGNGHTDTATVNVTVTAVNDPVTGAAPANASVNEDAVNAAITGMSISDIDAALAPAGVYDVSLSATQGTLTMTTLTGLTFTVGDGTGDTTMTFHGTLAAINTALATAKYTPTANYNGPAQINLQVTDTFGGIVATGTGLATNDSDAITVTVNSVNDEPAGTDDSAAPIEGATYTFLTTDFSDGFSDPIDGNGFAGVRITTLPPGASGIIKLNGIAITTGDSITKLQLDNGNLTFDAAAATGGTSPTFTFQVRDDGGILNGGVDLDQSPNTFTLNIAVANFAPVVDLDANDSSGAAGGNYATAFTEGGAAVAVVDTDVTITDADVGNMVTGATISISGAASGDQLTVVGALPGSIVAGGGGTGTITLSGTGTQAEYQTALTQIRYSNTGDDPTVAGTASTRNINITVTDGVSNSVARTATVAITGINDAPVNTIGSASNGPEDTPFAVTGISVADADSGADDITVTLNITRGTLTLNTGVAGGLGAGDVANNGTGIITLTGSKAEINATLADSAGLMFFGGGTSNGNVTLTMTTDDGGNNGSDPGLTGTGTSEADSDTRIITIIANNDAPVVIGVGNQTANSTNEDTPAAGQTVFNLFIARYSDQADNQSAFTNGSSPGSFGGIAVVSNASTFAGEWQYFDTNTSAWVNIGLVSTSNAALINSSTQIRFNPAPNFNGPVPSMTVHLIDNSVVPGITFGQHVDLSGVGATGGSTPYSAGTVVLDASVTAINDAPVNTLGGTIGTGEDAVNAWLSGMSIEDVDVIPSTDDIDITFDVDHGTLAIRTDVVGGITAGDITAQDADTITIRATQNEINTTLAAVNGLTYSPTLNFNGDDTLTVTTNDRGFTGADPGLTGTAGSEEDIDTRTISVSAFDDPADGVDDTNTVPENSTIVNGSVITNDTDVDGPLPVTVDQVNGSGANVGTEITLASGAKLTLRADGTYDYNPNGKFNYLTDNTSGAVDISAPDTFTYRLTNGDTATVTITVTGVVSDDDILFGDGTNNTITGTNGTDVFMMQGGGTDTVIGNGDVDLFFFGATLDATDSVNGGAGVDTLALLGDYTLTLGANHLNGIERLVLYSGSQAPGPHVDYSLTMTDAALAAGATLIVQAKNLLSDEQLIFNGTPELDGHFIIASGAGNDILAGGQKADSIDGGAGDDSLYGRAGDDFLFGGLGADQLRGGMGNDRFYYDNFLQSTAASKDSIIDFQTIDRIDLSGIDADGNGGNGDTAFTFIGNAAFGNIAGQLRATESGGVWTVEGDVNGDGVADLVISVTTVDPVPLAGADFVL